LARDRKISKEHKRLEESISPKNQYGITDPTPYKAVLHIKHEQQLKRGGKNGAANNIG
jgi:hypothetical protein